MCTKQVSAVPPACRYLRQAIVSGVLGEYLGLLQHPGLWCSTPTHYAKTKHPLLASAHRRRVHKPSHNTASHNQGQAGGARDSVRLRDCTRAENAALASHNSSLHLHVCNQMQSVPRSELVNIFAVGHKVSSPPFHLPPFLTLSLELLHCVN